MGKTEKALLKVVRNSEGVNLDKELLSYYEKALSEFKVLVSQGYTKSRGYSLQTIDDNLGTMAFNTEN